jgi:hypothetical protein
MATVIGRTQRHYEVQEVEFGRVYKWCPEYVIIRCDCGERLSLTGSTTVCKCGADYTAFVREGSLPAAQRLDDEALHPWRYAGDRKDAGLPC